MITIAVLLILFAMVVTSISIMAVIICLKPNDIDNILIILSLLFICVMYYKKKIPFFGAFWPHQQLRPYSEHAGERFEYRRIENKNAEYLPRTDREFWEPYLEVYSKLLSPLLKQIQNKSELANWMLGICGGIFILIAGNFDKFKIIEYNKIFLPNNLIFDLFFGLNGINRTYIPHKTIFLFMILTLSISSFLFLLFRLGLIHLKLEIEDSLLYIPLSEGIKDTDQILDEVDQLKIEITDLGDTLPKDYTTLVSRFETVYTNYNIKLSNNWRYSQIGSAFFFVTIFLIFIYYMIFLYAYT
jgi:hypothetical protein